MREKETVRKRGTDEGCHGIPRIYERKQGTRNRMAAGGGHAEVSEMPWEEEPASRTRRVDEKERSRNAGGKLEEENVHAAG